MNSNARYLFIAGLPLTVLAMVLLIWSLFGNHASYQTGLIQAEGVPASASDITIYRRGKLSGLLLADFKISESDFLAFAAANHWPVHPITHPVLVPLAQSFHQEKQSQTKEIRDGYFHEARQRNGGGVTVAYDRSSGRAYLERSSR